MCTLTIQCKGDNILVTMNRDEQRGRAAERAPFLWQSPSIFAPQDTKANGTWMGMNADGKIVALLNGYKIDDTQTPKQTRGEIIPKILSGQDIDPSQYASFHLVEVTIDEIKHSYWDGNNFEQAIIPQEEWSFFTSSSFKQDEVKALRHDEFQQWVEGGAGVKNHLPSIHLQHNNEATAQSVLMKRDDACTKSITQFEVSMQALTSRYWSQPHKNRDFKQYQGLF